MALARAHDMSACRYRHRKIPVTTLSETSAMHTCGLGSLAGPFRIVFTANCTYYCYRLVGGPFIEWASNVTGYSSTTDHDRVHTLDTNPSRLYNLHSIYFNFVLRTERGAHETYCHAPCM